MQKVIAPSILSADFANLKQDLAKVEAVGCNFIHIDVMDGHFVPNISIGIPVVKAIRKVTKSILDVHLMIAEPLRYAEAFFQAGADIATVHIETLQNPQQDLKQLKKLGKIGLSLNPDKSFADIQDFVHMVDLVLVMSVFPGFGGQEFIAGTLDTVRKLRKYINDNSLNVGIQVDGGINKNTIIQVAQAGADIFVAGSAIFNQQDPGQAFLELKNII